MRVKWPKTRLIYIWCVCTYTHRIVVYGCIQYGISMCDRTYINERTSYSYPFVEYSDIRSYLWMSTEIGVACLEKFKTYGLPRTENIIFFFFGVCVYVCYKYIDWLKRWRRNPRIIICWNILMAPWILIGFL